MRETPASPALATAAFLHSAAPDPASQIVQLSLNLGESCPVQRVQEAWRSVTDARGVFRSSFPRTPAGEFLCRENDHTEFAWSSLNWQEVPPAEIPARWQALLEEDAGHSFDLAVPPLIRFQAIELPGGHCHQLVTFPSMLLDEDELFHVLCEWLEALEGRPPAGGAADISYPAPTPAVSDWWSRFFSRAQEPLAFEVYPRPAVGPNPAGLQEHSVLLDRETSREFKALCQKLDVPPRDFALAAWSLVLSRLTSQETALLLAGCPQTSPENLLPCQPPPGNAAKASDWLRDVSQSERERIANAAISLERTLLLADLPRKLRDFPAAFFWLPPLLNDRIHDAFPRWINFDAKIIRRPQFPLTLLARDGNRLSLQVESDPAICPPGEAAALLERLVLAIEAILGDPSRKIGNLGILTGAEKEKLSAPETQPPTSSPEPVEKTFGAIAARQPDSLAISGPENAALSFAEVESHARSLATWLRNESLADGWNIAICLTPTPWLPVAILGILRAGDTCVPLDFHSSREWLAARIEQSDVEMIICDSGTAPLFDGTTRRLLTLDQQWETVAASTGGGDPVAPKNAFLLNGTEWDAAPALRSLDPEFVAASCAEAVSLWELQPGDRVPLLSAAGTAAFVETILGALTAGATIVLPAAGDPFSALDQEITHLRVSSDQLRVLLARLQHTQKSLPESLRTICVEMDSCLTIPRSSVALLDREHLKRIFFFSPAGLSGAGIHHLLDDLANTRDVPIGQPGRGLTATLHDPAGQPLPPSYPGRLEITFSGPVTEKFSIPAWRDKSGVFHFIPSHDAAVELAFADLPGVFDVHCTAVQGDPRPGTGVWVVMEESSAHLAPEASRAAAQRLPRHLRPDFVLTVAEFPLTSGGNIHSKNLPRPPASITHAEAKPADAPPVVSAREWEPVVPLHRNPDAPALFLINDLDGDCEKYKTLAAQLKNDWAIHATTARGLRNPSACHLTVETEAAALVEAICLLDPDGPFHLFGFGYGAILAMEMARQLRVAGRQVPYLALAGSRPPKTTSRPGWRGALSRVFSLGSSKGADPAPTSPAAQAHLAALANYQAKPLIGPAGIILGTDMGGDVEASWMDCIPEAIVEKISCPTAEMLAEPPVRRLAVILREWAVPSTEET